MCFLKLEKDYIVDIGLFIVIDYFQQVEIRRV